MRKLWCRTLLLILIVFISGCVSPLKQRDRVKRKVERLVQLYALDKDTVYSYKIDTLYKEGTLTIPEIKSDTHFIWGYKDTIISYTDAGIVTHLEFVHDTVKINTTVLKRDTVFRYKDVIRTVTKTVPITIEPEAPKKGCRIPLIGLPCWYIWLPFIILIVYLAGRLGIKLYKEWKT